MFSLITSKLDLYSTSHHGVTGSIMLVASILSILSVAAGLVSAELGTNMQTHRITKRQVAMSEDTLRKVEQLAIDLTDKR